MTIAKDYYIRDSKIFFSITDLNILYQHEWSQENLKINESIPLVSATNEQINSLKKHFKLIYSQKIEDFYKEEMENHKKTGLKSIEEFFDSFLQKEEK